MAIGLKEGKLNSNMLNSAKIDLVSHPACMEGSGNCNVVDNHR